MPRRRPPAADQEVHVLLCFADHYEPKYGKASPEVARARVAQWVQEYPRRFEAFRMNEGGWTAQMQNIAQYVE